MSDPSNLEFLRKQAKTILKQCRAGDTAALGRIRAQLPRFVEFSDAQAADQIKLADVHHALARERGHLNWAELKREDAPLEQFLVAVRGFALKDAQRALAAFPEMAAESIHAAGAIGDPDAVANHLNLDPNLLTAEHGGWPPLFYACGSPLNRASSRQSAGILECAQLLLDRGADPNTWVQTDYSDPESRVPAVLRAMMSANMPVQNLLIRSGANFDIKEIAAKMQRTQPLMSEAFGKYFKTAEVQQQFSERMAKMREQFKDPSADKWWFHGRAELPATSGKMFEGLLQRGYDPNTIGLDGLTVFQNIARTGTVEAIELFIAHGADINRLTPDGRAPLVLAIRAGNNLVTDALRAHGASDAGLRPIDELIGACLRVDVPEARAIVKSHPNATDDMSPEDFEPFVRAAAADILPQLRLMAESGFNLGGMGEAGITALHAAAWHGHLESIRLLLEFHAPVNVRDTTYGSSPLAWAAHGSRNCRSADDAYCAIVTALLEAGADYESAVSRAGVRPESIASARVAALLSPKDGIDNAVEP